MYGALRNFASELQNHMAQFFFCAILSKIKIALSTAHTSPKANSPI